MGRPESCFHAEPDRFHEKKFASKRGKGKPWLQRKIGIRI
jgi:hypothetical protein